MLRHRAAVVALCSAAAWQAVSAQADPHAGMGAMAGMHHEHAASAAAKAQIDSVERAMRSLGTTDAARAAGFQPVFGWIPTMGVHWVEMPRMWRPTPADRLHPAQLMFSPIGGKDSLVGAAYAYVTAVADTAKPPVLFDGAPGWHEHPDLAPPGGTLVMLHVWFVPSPDGPFAGTNPNLPFWALRLSTPDPVRMRDPAYSSRMRKVALALAEVYDTTSMLPRIADRHPVASVLAPARDTVLALVADMRRAERSHDKAAWDRDATRIAAQWDVMQAAFYTDLANRARPRVDRFFALLLGQHTTTSTRERGAPGVP